MLLAYVRINLLMSIIGPYECDVPVHETLGISVKCIIGPTDDRMNVSKDIVAHLQGIKQLA